jgi:hypothetical protein
MIEIRHVNYSVVYVLDGPLMMTGDTTKKNDEDDSRWRRMLRQ